MVVDISLLLQGLFIPANTSSILGSAFDVNLGEMDLDANLLVSIQVSANELSFLIEVNVFVELEANAVDWAPSILHLLDHIEDGVTSTAIPSTIHGRVTVIVVEQLSIWISLVSPLKCLAYEVINLVPWSVSSDSIWSIIRDSLIDNIPGEGTALVSTNSRLDVPFHEVFDLPCILLPFEEVRIERVLGPKSSVTSESHVILLGEVHNLITLSEIEVIP